MISPPPVNILLKKHGLPQAFRNKVYYFFFFTVYVLVSMMVSLFGHKQAVGTININARKFLKYEDCENYMTNAFKFKTFETVNIAIKMAVRILAE